jgi:hypothetical protein
MQSIQTSSIHPNGGARLTCFTVEFPHHQHQLCNNMILPWKAEIISVLICWLSSLGCKVGSKIRTAFHIASVLLFCRQEFIWSTTLWSR